jgi:hypothetical protein
MSIIDNNTHRKQVSAYTVAIVRPKHVADVVFLPITDVLCLTVHTN